MSVPIAHPMRAKFESKCPTCGRPIYVGQYILKMKDGGVKCRSCTGADVESVEAP